VPIPDFVQRLRARIGHDPLWLVGVTAVVLRGDEVLLVRRADFGNWSPIAGIVEPGEHTATAAEREALEEAGVVASVERLAGVSVSKEYTYPNGDRTAYTNLTYRLRYESGEARVNDDESTDVRWFPLDALPDLLPQYVRRIRHAVEDRPDAVLDREPEG
jgi:8-oxo-dGTP pyrophosphatase MutT (NUDIX family)